MNGSFVGVRVSFCEGGSQAGKEEVTFRQIAWKVHIIQLGKKCAWKA